MRVGFKFCFLPGGFWFLFFWGLKEMLTVRGCSADARPGLLCAMLGC